MTIPSGRSRGDMLIRFRSARAVVCVSALTTGVILGCAGGSPSVPDNSDASGGFNGKGTGGSSSTGASTAVLGSGGFPAGIVQIGSGGVTAAGSTTSTLPTICGDGIQVQGEACDDANTKSGDGCAGDCKLVEEGYVCLEPGQPCAPAQSCGDKKISGTENCDDGNSSAGDGCTDTCRTERGWACPFVGARCIADQCGDGIVAGAETCDDGNSDSGDGCSSTCTLETAGPTERDAWVCSVPGQPCQRTTCDNGIVEGTEQCDDGNNDGGDGCTPACRKEPQCPVDGGACKSVCGDGMILPDDTDQECDDGNSANGDGCSAECTTEPGYECTPEAVKPTGQLVLPIIYRDFKGGTTTGTGFGATVAWDTTAGQHPDFEHANGRAESGIVQPKLGVDGKPVHSPADRTRVTTFNDVTASTPDWFSLWYRDAVRDLPTPGSPRYNYTFVEWLTLAETAASSGTFTYANPAFFPLDGRGWGNYPGTNPSHNFHFTSEVRYWFQYAGNELLTFAGDDDVWVFVNKQLVLDLGGIHNAWTGTVQLDASSGSASVVCSSQPNDTGRLNCQTPQTTDLGLQMGKVYEIVVFQAERHTTESHYTLTVSAFTATRSVCKSLCGDAIVTPDEACDLGREKNTGAYGTCTPDCRLPASCGDGHVDSADGEQCDDGVNLASYGYNNTPACGPGCQWTDHCGDGKVDSLFGEQCDDGNHAAGDGCESNCTTRPGCGNAVLDPSEQCDDGNAKSGDGCSEFCTVETILL